MKYAIITDTHLKTETIDLNISLLGQLLEYCKCNGISDVIHAGDIFTDRSGGQQLQVLLAFRRMLDMLENAGGVKLITVAGNHDKIDLNSTQSYIDVFKSPNLETTPLFKRIHESKKVNIYTLSYFKEIDRYQSLLSELSEIVRGECEDGRKAVLVTHIAVNGAATNGDGESQSCVTVGMFGAFDTVLIGHYHDHSRLSDNVQYIGSAYQSNFGEDADKGFVVLDTDTLLIERVKLKFPEYMSFVINVDHGISIDYDFINGEIEGGNKVKVILTGEKTAVDSFDNSKLKSVGVKVEKLNDDVYKNVIISNTEKLEVLTPEVIAPKYEKFCKKEGFDKKIGLEILNRI